MVSQWLLLVLALEWALVSAVVSAQAAEMERSGSPQCRPPAVTFHWPGTQEKKTVHPNHGDRYTVVRGEAGDFRAEPR